MAMTPATPRPWTHSADEGVYDTISGGMGMIADGVMRADADLIVRAVNAHDALLAALRALAEAAAVMLTAEAYSHRNELALIRAEEQARALLRDLSPKEEGLEPDAGVLDVVGDA